MILNALVERLKRRSKHDFKGRHFEASLILQAVSWYLRYPLSYRDIEEMFLERGLEVDHSTLNRWVLAYAPLIERRLRAFRKPHCGSIRVDETYIRIRGQWRDFLPGHHTPRPPVAPGSSRKGGAPAARSAPPRDQAPSARDRERSLPGQAAHAAGRRLSNLRHGAAHDPGLRGDAVAAQGLRLCGHMDGVRAEPA